VQTRQVLERIDRLLQSAGTDKPRLLSAMVWRSDFRTSPITMPQVWNKQVDGQNPPARACVGAALWRPGLPVEIMVTASR
jgi:enamine deaminase RidA (YjgF/YER057c/UK114 family)